jgi:sec-independent protein translocase protein TatA
MPLGLGFGEAILVFLMIVLLFGLGKLPDVGGNLGRSVREFRDALRGGGEDETPRVAAAPTLPPPDAATPTLEAAPEPDEAATDPPPD